MKKAINRLDGSDGTAAVEHFLKSDVTVFARPLLFADWNINRYGSPTAENTPTEDDEGYDIEIFPIESITDPVRPTKGINKALVGATTASAGYRRHEEPRFYVASEEDVYKYWISPFPTDGTGNFPLHDDDLTSARPRVEYDRAYKVNKLVLKVENTWASPSSHQIFIRDSEEGSWASAATNPTIADDGTITLYYNGTSWSSNKPDGFGEDPLPNDNDAFVNIQAIEYRVDSLGPGKDLNGDTSQYLKFSPSASAGSYQDTTGENAHLSIIAIEAHRVENITDRLISVDDTFDAGEQSQLYPVGTVTKNTGSINLTNHDNLFGIETEEYDGLLEAGVLFELQYLYSSLNDDVGGYAVEHFKMWGDVWTGRANETVSIELNDCMQFLDNVKPPEFMIEGCSTSEVIWRLLDSVGFNNYKIHDEDFESPTEDEEGAAEDYIIPFFWSDGEQTAMELIDSVAKQTQTIVYVDHNDVIHVRKMKREVEESESVWTLHGQREPGRLPDIMNVDTTSEVENNHIEVTYRETDWKRDTYGNPTGQEMWEPEDDIVLRSTPLKKTLDKDKRIIAMGKEQGKIWPYSGFANIEGEIVEFDAKRYCYYTYSDSADDNPPPGTEATKANWVWVTSQEDQEKFDSRTPDRYRYKNFFNGNLRIKKGERGAWNTIEERHPVKPNNYNVRGSYAAKGDVRRRKRTAGFNFNAPHSTVTLNTPGYMKNPRFILLATKGGQGNRNWNWLGSEITLMKKSSGGNHARAGIVMNNMGGGESGYYIEVRPTVKITGKNRKTVSEVMIWSKMRHRWHLIAKGRRVGIYYDVPFELEVKWENLANEQHRLEAWVNGSYVAGGTTTWNTRHDGAGRWGIYAKGKTRARFEYLYGYHMSGTNDQKRAFYDRKRGGYYTQQGLREWTYKFGTRRMHFKKKRQWKRKRLRLNKQYFDEFGPIVHEIREFDVKFEEGPVQSSYLMMTNDWAGYVLDYKATPFGAKFTVANVARRHAVLNGEDTSVRPGDSEARGVNQRLIVIGTPLEKGEEETVTAENEESIRINGRLDTGITGDWIQSKHMAESLSNWIKNYWSSPVDTINVDAFGNPLIEVGDVVDIKFDRWGMTPETHKYFVVGVNNSFESGIATSLTLRRVRDKAAA